MAYTFTSRFFIGSEKLATMLSNVTAFQTWTGAANATAALAFIHQTTCAASAWTRPRAMIGFDMSSIDMERVAGGANGGDQFSVTPKSDYRILFEQDLGGSYTSDPEGGAKQFLDKVGLIIDGLMDLSGISPYPSLEYIRGESAYDSRLENGDPEFHQATILVGVA